MDHISFVHQHPLIDSVFAFAAHLSVYRAQIFGTLCQHGSRHVAVCSGSHGDVSPAGTRRHPIEGLDHGAERTLFYDLRHAAVYRLSLHHHEIFLHLHACSLFFLRTPGGFRVRRRHLFSLRK